MRFDDIEREAIARFWREAPDMEEGEQTRAIERAFTLAFTYGFALYATGGVDPVRRSQVFPREVVERAFREDIEAW